MRTLGLVFLLASSACTQTPPPGTPDMGSTDPATSRPLAVLAGSDFQSGTLSSYSLASGLSRTSLDTVDAQSIVRVFGDKVYVMDQTHGVVRVYDPNKGFKDPAEFPTGNSTIPGAQGNPHDLYVDQARQRAFVTLYGKSSGIDGDHALGMIDLTNATAGISLFIPLLVNPADPDKNPDADRLFACGNFLYVTLQDLDRNNMFRPAAPARLARIDISQQQISPAAVQYLQLKGQNPVGVALPGGDCTKVLIGHGDYQFDTKLSGKGGIEQVDLMAQTSAGLLMTDIDLGGHISALDAADLQHVFVDLLTNDGTFQHAIYVVDADRRMKGGQVLGTLAFVPAVRVYRDKLLVLSAGTPKGTQLKTGLYLGPVTGLPLTTAPIDTGLPPVSIDIY